MKYVAFDIETTKLIPEGDKWRSHYPLGVSCAATMTEDGEAILWHGQRESADRGLYPLSMTPREIRSLVSYLFREYRDHQRIPITWNGLGFDFDVLSYECEAPLSSSFCRFLAVSHIDIAFQMLCEKGFMIGLNAAAKGLKVPGKLEGMKGNKAPVMWAGELIEQERVLQYVRQDVIALVNVYEEIMAGGQLPWISKKGRWNKWIPTMVKRQERARLLTVGEAITLPEPDTSWMTSKMPRSQFYGWLSRLDGFPSLE